MSNAKVILYVIANGALGGAEIATLGLMQHHRRYKPVAVFLRPGPMEAVCRQSGIDTYSLKTHMRLRNPFSILRASAEISQIAKQTNAMAIHSCMAYAHVASLLSSQRLGLKKFLFHHGPFGSRLDLLASRLGQPVLLTNSLYMRRQISLKGCGQAHCIPLGPVALQRGEKKLDYQKSADEITIVSAARLDPNKGQHIALHALANLPPHCRLLLVGESLPGLHAGYRGKLEGIIAKLNLSSQVTFTGAIEDMQSVYDAADIFLHTSLEEAHGLGILEAMENGVPVVAAKVGGVPEIVTQAENGLLFTRGNANHCAEALLKYIEHPETARRYAENAQELVRSEFSASASIDTLEEIYDRTIAALPGA